jgi:hypothetical protein
MITQPQVNVFDDKKAKMELKSCPKIVRDYVRLLEEHNKRWKELTGEAIGKLKDSIPKERVRELIAEKEKELKKLRDDDINNPRAVSFVSSFRINSRKSEIEVLNELLNE